METGTIETFMENLGLHRYIDIFKDNEVELELLLDLSENELDKILKDLKLPIGIQMKILKGLQYMKKMDQSQMKPTDVYRKSVETYPSKYKTETMEQYKEDHELYSHSKEAQDTAVPKVEDLVGTFEKLATPQQKQTCRSSQCEKTERRISSKKITDKDEVRLVLLGKTGSGKSATGNTILGTDEFKTYFSGSSGTKKTEQHSAFRFNKKLVVVDTPGIFDTEKSNAEILEEIKKCVLISAPGPHAFILVLRTDAKFTEEEAKSIEHFVDQFGQDAYNYFIVLFTRKDLMNAKKITLQDHIKTSPQRLQDLIIECGRRVLAFNNECNQNEEREQVNELLNMIFENMKANGADYYTNRMYIKAEEDIKKREAEKIQAKMMQQEKEFQQRYGEELDEIRKNCSDEKEIAKKLDIWAKITTEQMKEELEKMKKEIRDSSRKDIVENGSKKWCTIL